MSEILIFAEIEDGDLHSTAGELIAAGRKISNDTGDSVSAAIIGGNQDLGSKAIACNHWAEGSKGTQGGYAHLSE